MKKKLFGSMLLAFLLYLCPNLMAQNNRTINQDSGVIFSSNIIGTNPDQPIAGVPSGTAPWVVKSGTISISSDGKVKGKIKGLMIPGIGPGPVTKVAACLVCGGSGGTIVATTSSFPHDMNGDVKISDTINLPASCPAPIVLIRITALNGDDLPAPINFIANSGISGAQVNQNRDSNQNSDQ